MRIYKRGKYYWLDYTFKGKRIRKSLGVTDRKSAKELAAIYVEQIRKGELGVIDDKPILFEDAVKKYLEYYKNHVSPTTFKTESNRANLLISHFKGKLLHEITPWMIEQYINERLLKVKPSTVNREIAFLKGLYKKFTEWKYISKNPMESIKMLKEPPGVIRYLDEEELFTLKQALEKAPIYLRALVIVALNTGMRKGELMALKWRDVDFKNRIIIATKTKNNERRIIPMNDEVYHALLQLGRHIRSEYIFVNPKTGKPYVDLKNSWKKLMKEAGIENFRFHDLRHTFASYLAMSGVSPLVIQELLGHKTLTMTKRYSHLSRKHLEDAVKKMQIYGTNMAQSRKMRKSSIVEFPTKNNMRRAGLEPATHGLRIRCSTD